MISLDYQDDENIEKHPHLNWVVVLVDLNSKSTIDMLIILITFDMIKIVIVNLVKLLLKMLKMMLVSSTFRKWWSCPAVEDGQGRGAAKNFYCFFIA